MGSVRLDGCRDQPLAGYLKAIGVLRLVAEQADPAVRGRWQGGTFVLDTDLDADGLVGFLVDRYVPTPIITPWNKGSGFGPDDHAKSPAAFQAVTAVHSSTDPRLLMYRDAIDAVLPLTRSERWAVLDKAEQVAWCRGVVPDRCVEWIDAAVVITSDDRQFPPLLGTGGNDGRLDFGSNFMQRLLGVLGVGNTKFDRASVERLTVDALFGTSSGRLDQAAIGQFDPAGAGGQRSAPDGAAVSLSNPWDFVLLFEGAAAFASGVARRFGAGSSKSAMPFTVAGVAAAYGSAANEKSRGEFWAPLWRRSASAPEVLRLISEGRVEYAGRQARTAVDVARALGSLGVDRGIDEFVRYGFLERNGLSTFCVPVGRLGVADRPAVAVLGDLDRWVDSVRRVGNRPASADVLLRSIDGRNIEISQDGSPHDLQELLFDVSELERLVRSSRSLSTNTRPWAGLKADTWAPLLDDHSPEFAVAAALASLRAPNVSAGWLRTLTAGNPVTSQRAAIDGFGQRDLRRVLADCVIQIFVRTARSPGDPAGAWCGPARAVWCAERAFIDFATGACDDRRVERLLSGLMLLDWSTSRWTPATVPASDARSGRVPTEIAVLKALFHHRGLASTVGLNRPLLPDRSIPRLLAADQVPAALRAAIRDLRVAGCRPHMSADMFDGPHAGNWLAASALVPVSDVTAARLLRRVASPTTNTTEGSA